MSCLRGRLARSLAAGSAVAMPSLRVGARLIAVAVCVSPVSGAYAAGDDAPAFEVASIKPSARISEARQRLLEMVSDDGPVLRFPGQGRSCTSSPCRRYFRT